MTKVYLKILTALILLFTSITSNSQVVPVCVTCVDDDILITCGETTTIFGDGYITSSFSDDFNSWTTPITPNPAVWNSITPGGTTGNSTCTSAPTPFANCSGGGVIAAGNYLWFPHGSSIPRQATTIGINVSSGGDLAFEYKMEAQSGSCDGPDLALEGTMIQYSINFGATWIDMPANFFPFNVNPAPYTNIAYFSPLNPQLQTFTSWNQYTIPIPLAAQTANTIFRWSQIAASSTQFDFWGLENLNIITTPPGGSAYQWEDLSTGIITLGQTLTVSPTVLTNYEFTYTSSSLSCSTTVEVDVAPPIVDPVIVVNPLSPCAASTDLDANVNFNTCNYKIYLYDNGGDGWVTIPQTSSSIDNRLEVYVDGVLFQTITMSPPGLGPDPYGPGTDQYGPVIWNIPISAAPGATFETRFLTGGPNPAECAYFITDNQGQLIIDPTSALPYPSNAISAMGLTTSPSTPFWPIPTGLLPSVGFTVPPLDFGPMTPSCPTTNLYSYSWEIATGPAPGGVGTGSTVGITPPNTQATSVVTATPQNYMVSVTDLTNPGCTANGIVNVPGLAGSWNLNPIVPNPACEGDCVDLGFSGLLPYPWGGPYTIIIEMIDASGSSSNMYTINSSGNIVGTGGLPINLCPTISTSVPSATFNITSFIDNADPNGCEIPITNASQTVTFSTQPNAGTPPLINPIFCLGDPTIDLSTLLSNNPDVGGTWTYTSGPGPAPLNMPFGGLNYMFDPSTNPAGDYTYTASNSPCLDHTSTITIILDPGPIAGQLPLIPVNMCMGETINLNNEFITNPFPNTPVWTSNGNGVSNNFTPTLSGAYTFRSTITDPASSCPDVWAEIDIEVHDLPTVLFSTVNQICLGESLDLSFVLTGVAPFTITVTDNILPPFNVIADINGNDFITGNPITYTPANAGITNLTVTNISDAFCSITTAQNSVVAVSTPPNSGVLILPLSVCEDDLSVYDLSNQLAGQDLTGYWIDANGVQQPTSPSFNFDVSMPSGNYTYVVTSAICTTAQTIVPVAVINTPITGSANPQEICINDYGAGNLYNLNNLLSGSYDPGTWYESGVPIPTNINPSTYGVGTTTFTYQVNGIPPCANATINVDLTINPEPVVLSFTSFNPITGLPASSTTQGYAIGLDVTMLVGAVPFTINISDDDSPFNTGSIFIASGMSGSTTMMPNVLPTTTYDVSLITDGNGCTTTYNGTVPVTVIPYPIVTFSTLTPEICENEIATIEFNLVQGVVPVTVDYVLHGNSYTEILNSVGVTTVNIPNPNLIFGINTFSVSSIIDVNLEAAPNIPNDIQIVYNQNPSVTFSTTTPVICYKDDAILQLDFSAGAPPFTVNYSDNGIPVIPPLIFNNLGTQTSTLSPDPSPGDHPYDIIDIIDANLCVGTIVNTENILVRELPELDIVISGDNPICFGDFSELSFPVLSGSPPFNLSLLEESNSITLNVDAAGLVSGSPYQIPNPGQYTTTYTLTSVTDANTCTQSLSDSKTLIVNEIPVVDVSGTTEICKDDYTNINFDFSAGTSPWTLSYNINGIVGTPFDLDSISDRIVVSPTTTSIYTYTAIEDSNGCKDNFTDAATITVNPLPEMEVTGGGEVCNDGSTVDVIFNTSNGTPTFDFEYTVGINTKYVSNVGYQHIIATNEAGTYIVTNITDDKGCVGKSITGIADVIVHPMPVADFDVYPQPAEVTNPVINFTDNSTGHIAGTWDFDDNSTTNTNFGKLSHRFSDLDSGTYYVELYVESNKGCWDTQLQKIVIDNAFIFYIPNSFTPNNDMVNDLFFPYIEGVKEYDFYIYSRQGQEIFHTTDVNEGWDGYVANGDNYAISGKYAYAIYIIDLHGKERKYQGHFLLIR